MTTLKMAFHAETGRRMVEVYGDDGSFIAAIYPTENGSNSIHIVSKHFADDPIQPSLGQVPVPGYLVTFNKGKQ
ncbi:hypothetical protein [Bradyrhizobium zhanjiangense]|uniref:Uncharacterized protein n=1 Tax=Bradyrhizobium zhanjiangense TaxID=1325107 RepID=A0ABY0DFT0_9BRAD|nr:hypothetical protein [Bradyrhizobium zhanjiangense]RXG91608.1 hypothetical protein EAS62_24320 [Bradyrhizobium zhanjiangense]